MAFRVVCEDGAAAYVWRSDDTVERVAARFNASVAEIRAINAGIIFTRLQPGELICVPTENIQCPGNRTYRVQDGDNLVEIAQRLGLRPGQLLAANPYIDPDQLSVGQLICVPETNPDGGTGDNTGGTGNGSDAGCTNCCPAGAIAQTVRPGDSLARILSRNDIPYEQFRELNPNLNDTRLVPGQRYCVPQVAPVGVCETDGMQSYVWAVGDTLVSVAARYRLTTADILRMNPGLRPSEFTPGRVICLPER